MTILEIILSSLLMDISLQVIIKDVMRHDPKHLIMFIGMIPGIISIMFVLVFLDTEWMPLVRWGIIAVALLLYLAGTIKVYMK